LGTLGISCYILADTYFVSKGSGTNGLAALNLAIPVYNFIHGAGVMLGMGGATGLSPAIGIIIMLSHWIKRKNTFHICRTKVKAQIVGLELALGFPSIIAQLSAGIVMITFNAIILKLEGNTGVAAYGVVANISLMVVAIYTGIAQGVQPLISHFYGKNIDRQVRTLMRYSL